MSEIGAISQFIYHNLSNYSDLSQKTKSKVYHSVAPKSTKAPYIIYSLSDGEEAKTVGGGGIIYVNYSFLVKVISESASPKESQEISSLIYKALVVSPTEVKFDPYQVDCLGRDHAIMYTENVGDSIYTHSGGIYEFFVYEA